MDSSKNWRNNCKSFQEKLNYILTQSFLADLTIKLFFNGSITEIKAHKIFLQMNSEVFEKMLKADFIEGISNVIEIRDIDPNTFVLLLRRFYGQIISLANIEEAWDLFFLADKYLDLDTREFCLHYIKTNINAKNVIKCFELADIYDVSDIKEKCLQIMRNNASNLVKSRDFLDAGVSTVENLLAQEFLNIKEIDLFDAFVSWANSIVSREGEDVKEEICTRLIPKFSFQNMTAEEFLLGPAEFYLLSQTNKFDSLTNFIMSGYMSGLPEGYRNTKRLNAVEISTDSLPNHTQSINSWSHIVVKTNRNISLAAVLLFTNENEENEIIQVALTENEPNWRITKFMGRVNCKSTFMVKFAKPFRLIRTKQYILAIRAYGKRKVTDLKDVKLSNDDVTLQFSEVPAGVECFSYPSTLPLASLIFCQGA